ncbi:hypothetical protein UC3_02375 [Enterococcus phoeniculicola ATCC BAA-412]|uniref:KOW domain-containing protein n=2 Tax=Enterococcus phoeniculicola TaxID=154621 RepID=R3W2Z1_9ENTE|nr:hypothetical protein UC3_02375 [Enterococcus phoeniculicola ATCC BAA-412]EOT79694.1 hypothetical protein I589_01206 [Enterococcus phoeniculicola ATCC BAA-412]
MRKKEVKVGGIYMGKPRGFINKIRCQVLNVYENSVHVKIICCVDQRDEDRQLILDEQTVCPLKTLEEV